MAPQFERGFLRDDFGIRARLGIPDPPLPQPADADYEGVPIDAAVFVAWHERAAEALAANPAALPMLYQIWLQRPGATGDDGNVERTGRAVYFEANGRQYSVFASLSPTIVARELPAGWLRERLLPAQKQSMGWVQTVIPRLEEALPHSALRPADANGDIALSPQGFMDLFVGTGVTLELGPFAAVFQRELQEFADAAAHARSCAGPLRLSHF